MTHDGPAGAGVVVANPPPPLRLVCVPAIEIPVPRTRSLLMACDSCGAPVWVHLRVLLAVPADVFVELCCGRCRFRTIVREAVLETNRGAQG